MLRDLWDDLRSSMWFLPGTMTVGAIGGAWIVLRADRWVASSELELGPWGYGGGADSARQVLSTIAGSIVTVTGVTFSITMVALVLAAGQYSPRVLRNFVGDRVNQTVLGMFVGTFLYTLLILRAIRAGEDAYVPALAVTGAIALAATALGFFLYFLHHIANSIQVSNIIRSVARDTRDEIERTFGKAAAWTGPPGPSGARVPLPAPRIDAEAEGYVTWISEGDLVGAARDRGVALELLVGPGEFVSRGAPLAVVDGEPPDPDDLADVVRGAIRLGSQRTLEQDPGYGFRQLVDIAVRALSPGINDPTTACNCVDYLGGLLTRLAEVEWPEPEIRDEEGILRLRVPEGSFADYVDLACAEIRRYGRSDLATTLRLLDALARAATAARDEDRRAVLRAQAEAVLESAAQSFDSPVDRRRVSERAERLEKIVGAELRVADLASVDPAL